MLVAADVACSREDCFGIGILWVLHGPNTNLGGAGLINIPGGVACNDAMF